MKKIKKDSFMQGAMFATLFLVLSKILGIIYVIPFHAIIGEQGRALYGYAYNMYALFLNLSTIGLPLAISKIVSEYNALHYQDAKKRSYLVALWIVIGLAIAATLGLFFLAPTIANTIIGGTVGGNNKEDIVFVLRVSTTAILSVTIISTMRGYLQGHKYIRKASISDLLEQFVRVIVIVFGSYFMMKLFGTKEAVGIAVFGATVGSLASLCYLGYNMKKVKEQDEIHYVVKEEEKQIKNKDLFKKLLSYAIPFVLISIVVTLCNTIDTMTLVKNLVKYAGMKTNDAETVLSVISTWGAKLNVIVTSIASGLVVSVLPNITGDYAEGNLEGIRNKINKTLQILLFLVMPMVTGLSLLAAPIWTIFYGSSDLCVQVFRFSVFTALFYSLYLNINVMMQSLNRYKKANLGLALCLFIKLIFNVPMVMLFGTLGLPAYYGATLTTIVAYLVPIIISLHDLKQNFGVSYQKTWLVGLISLGSTLFMALVLIVLGHFFPFATTSRVMAIVYTAVYALIGVVIYFAITSIFRTTDFVFGTELKDKIRRKLKRKDEKEKEEKEGPISL